MSKTVVGGRAKIYVNDQLVGLFESCSVAESLSTEDIHILGRFSPDEIVVTSYNSVTVSCSGFRVAGNGVKLLPKFPKLADLIGLGTVKIDIVDRQPDASGNLVSLATVFNCVPETNNVNFSARATSRVSISYKGTMMTDENSKGDGETGASNLP